VRIMASDGGKNTTLTTDSFSEKFEAGFQPARENAQGYHGNAHAWGGIPP